MAEVESLINAAVAEVVADDDSLSPHCELLTDKLVEALSKSADWIELYGVTGELVVPENLSEDAELAAAFAQLKEVSPARQVDERGPLTRFTRSLGSLGRWTPLLRTGATSSFLSMYRRCT